MSRVTISTGSVWRVSGVDEATTYTVVRSVKGWVEHVRSGSKEEPTRHAREDFLNAFEPAKPQ